MLKIGDLVRLRSGFNEVGTRVYKERQGLVRISYSRTFFSNEFGLYLGTNNLAEYKSEKPGFWEDIILVGEEKLHIPQGVLVKAEVVKDV